MILLIIVSYFSRFVNRFPLENRQFLCCDKNKTIADLFSRRDRYQTDQRRKRNTAAKIALPAAALCLAILAGVGLRRTGNAGPVQGETGERVTQGISAIGTISDRAEEPPAKSIVWAKEDVNHPVDSGFTPWGDKNSVSLLLCDALAAGKDGDVFAILAHPSIDYTFEYEGKTLEAYFSAQCAEGDLPEILAQLRKDGPFLKYGTALYETGTPAGEKWARSLYEERVSYYGEDLLNRYIVDGKFLQEDLERDLEAAKGQTSAREAYRTALKAYYAHLVSLIYNGIIPAGSVRENGIVLYFTQDQFSAFSVDGIEGWTFGLAVKDDAAVRPSDADD